VAKRGVINDWLNDWYGDATAYQNFHSQWFLMAKIFHAILSGISLLSAVEPTDRDISQ
jgi:hypothetical protein